MSRTVLEQHIHDRNIAIASLADVRSVEYIDVLKERAARYAAHVASMAPDKRNDIWRLTMEEKFQTEFIRIHWYVADWLTALLIARYGEEPDKARATDFEGNPWPGFEGWPNVLSDEDRAVMAKWLEGNFGKSRQFLHALNANTISTEAE